MERRQFLRVAGTGGVAGLAGCSEVLGNRADGPASFSASLSGPASVPVGESFSVTVSVTNTGGSPGTFDGVLTLERASGTSLHSVTVPDVAPGASASVTAGPWTVTRPGRAVAGLESSDARHVVDCVAATRGAAESFSRSGVDVTVTRLRYGGRYRHPDAGVVAPPAGSVFAYANVTASGAASASVPPRDAFRLAVGDVTRRPRRPAALPDGRRPYRPANARSDGEISGWLQYVVPAAAVAPAPRVELAWRGDEALARWRFEGVSTGVPRFVVRRVVAPGGLEVGLPGTVAAVVSNVGTAGGTYEGTLVRRADGEPVAKRPLSGPVARGATERIATSIRAPATDPVDVRIRPDGASAAFPPANPVVAYGSRYRSPASWTLSLADVVRGDGSLVYRTAGGNVTNLAATGEQFVFVAFSVRNPTAHEKALPADASLELPDGRRVTDATPGGYDDRRLVAPREGRLWRDRVPAHGVRRYWHVFEVPADARLSPLRVHVEDPGTVGGEPVHVTFDGPAVES